MEMALHRRTVKNRDQLAYLAFGRGEIHSKGNFSARREGYMLYIDGTVTNGFDTKDGDNMFDFHGAQPGAHEARILEAEQARTGNPEAAPFAMQFDRRQDVEAELEYQSGGSLRLLKSKWGKIY
ncbi:MAG: hypothetical protein H6851_00225 [Geminicoccaceae bacterium]|nr:hypothetical protein [Geminicoccaceae bacterium]